MESRSSHPDTPQARYVWALRDRWTAAAYSAVIDWAERNTYEPFLSLFPDSEADPSPRLRACMTALAPFSRGTYRRMRRPGYSAGAFPEVPESAWADAGVAPLINVYRAHTGVFNALRSVSTLWDWVHPAKLEDLGFRRANGAICFYSVAHERLAHFVLDQVEAASSQVALNLRLSSMDALIRDCERVPEGPWPEADWQ